MDILDDKADVGVYVQGEYFDTAEHAFQTYKFTDPEIRRIIRFSDNPEEMAKGYAQFIRPNWLAVSFELLVQIRLAKAVQHGAVRDALYSSRIQDLDEEWKEVLIRLGEANEKQVGGQHYKDNALQPWAVMQAWFTEEEFKGFLKGNALKYIYRAGRKGSAVEDYEKAVHYLEKLIEVSGP